MKIVYVALILWAVVALDGASAKRLRLNRLKNKEPVAAEEQQQSTQLDHEELNDKFSFGDPAAKNFKTTIESDRKSFGVGPNANSHFSSEFSFGTKAKTKNSYGSPVHEDDSEDDGSYEVNYKTSVTHKPSSFDFSSFKASTSSPSKSKFSSTKFGSSSGEGSTGLFKFNEGAGQITTKFAINHPAPTHTASSLGGSYQTFPDDGHTSSSGYLTEKFINDYHSALSKLKKEPTSSFKQPSNKFESSIFKSKFGDNSNFKVSSDFKVGGSKGENEYFDSSNKFSSFKTGSSESVEFKPNFKLQEVPNLYPSDDQFRPIQVGSYESSSSISKPSLFNPSSSKEEFIKQQRPNPASKGQYQQFLKAQQDEKIEQQALLEQLKYQQQKGFSRPSFSSGNKFRPIVNQKPQHFSRRKPSRVVSPGLSHYRTPLIDGPYTIHFSV